MNILSLIEKLEASGEIAFMVNSNTRFLSLFMKRIAQNEEINKAKEKECDLLLETIKNYKRFYLNS